MEKEVKNYGTAYAFFDCNASRKEVEDELVTKVRPYAEVPSELELTLTEDTDNLREDAEAMKALEAAKGYSLGRLPENMRESTPVSYRYALRAKLPNATNQSAADKLNRIMILMYGKRLYPQKEEFFGEIVYEQNGRYVSN